MVTPRKESVNILENIRLNFFYFIFILFLFFIYLELGFNINVMITAVTNLSQSIT